MVSSCGIERVSTAAYDWHGMRRGRTPFALFQYTFAGKGRLSYEGRSFEVLPGQAMILHFPHNHRYWWPAGNPPWEFLWVCLYGSDALRIWAEIESRRGPLATIAPGAPLFRVFDRIMKDPVADTPRSTFHVSGLAYEFVMGLAEETIPHVVETPDEGRSFQNVIRHCRQHFHESIGVEDLARVAGLSRYHFSRLFKRSQGMAPAEFLANLRLQEAVRLLRAEKASIKEIAARCGYRDANYFCRSFRRALGTSPGDFRKSGRYRA
jgi:AraC-like DNA-binding protein